MKEFKKQHRIKIFGSDIEYSNHLQDLEQKKKSSFLKIRIKRKKKKKNNY